MGWSMSCSTTGKGISLWQSANRDMQRKGSVSLSLITWQADVREYIT